MSNLFVSSNADGDLILTVPGYVLVAVLIFAALVLIASLASKEKKFGTKQLAFAAVAIALAMVTSMIKLFHLPMGGSITLFSMFFICLVGYWYGPVVGLTAGIAYGLLQFIIDPYIVSLPQVLVDYVFAFGALGLSGFFSNQKYGMVKGYILGICGRFFFAVLSGVIFFAQYAPENMSPLAYSAAYNGSYIFAEGIITVILMLVPAVSKALQSVKAQAVS